MSSSPYHPSAAAASLPHRAPVFHAPVAASNAPPGTFAPGTKVQVGKHRVVVEKYLSEGGFAHVYLVRVPRSGDKTEVAVLKRVAVPDKEALANMRTEVETMKKLKGHRHIVTYIDSHASQLKGGGYEVFLLMEYCAGGGLIDFMNIRLQHRLTEPEILKIFSDVAEGVACMHYLKPPLLHRDLKVENVLISTSGSSRIYKLCDFGSTAPPRPAATTAAEGRLIEDDVQRHTTLQYRSPEMIDVYRKQPIDEKSDIWALGVLLYKLCYYTTPFEAQGQMAILNASFKFPHYPSFSERTKKLIGWMLKEDPRKRPNIYQVIKEVCSMRNTDVPIKDIYANRTHSEARRNEQLPPAEPQVSSPPLVGIISSPPINPVQTIPEITSMRRGRPTAPAQQAPTAAKPSPSPMRGTTNDPFTALDSSSVTVRTAAADELAARFPSLDEFSLLHDRGTKFQFEQASPTDTNTESLNKRVTEALADDAFVQSKQVSASSHAKPASAVSRSASIKKSSNVESQLDPIRRAQPSPLYQPTPQRPNMVSTGTMTSPSPTPPSPKYPDYKDRPVYRFLPPEPSNHHRALSQPRALDSGRATPASLRTDARPAQRPVLRDLHRSKSQTATLTSPKSPASSRPSLEGQRPAVMDLGDPISRAKSANSRPRPSSVHVESDLDYLRDRETSHGRNTGPTPNRSELSRVSTVVTDGSESGSGPEETNISSNVEFLRAMEGDDPTKRKDRRSSGGNKYTKRTSLPSISLSTTKNILAGKFGDAFRRFEGNSSAPPERRTPSPPPDRHGASLTPIAGSEATGGQSDDEALDETQELPPEVRRELERRRLSAEEKRVAEAAAEYRRRLAAQGEGSRGRTAAGGGTTRASTIQSRVKSLLDEKKASPVRTAEGYGHFTDVPKTSTSQETKPNPPAVARKPVAVAPASGPVDLSYAKTRQLPASAPVPSASATTTANPVPVPAPAPSTTQRSAVRPSAPPKPKALRTGGAVESPTKPSMSVAGRPPPPPLAAEEAGAANGEDWEESFSKRYPSLSGLEMVEAEIGNVAPPSVGVGGTRVRDI